MNQGQPRWSNLEEYVKEPYNTHQQYIDDLLHLAQDFPEEVSRKNSGSPRRTVLQILQSGASYNYFGYLRNGSEFMYMPSPRERDLLPWGTTGSEALHRQLGYTMRTATIQHEDRVVSKALAFSLDSMLAHNSAAYSPTVTQISRIASRTATYQYQERRSDTWTSARRK